MGQVRWLPAALLVTVLSEVIYIVFQKWFPALALGSTHLVSIPVSGEFLSGLTVPDWSALSNINVWKIALTIEVVDKLDHFKRKTPLNRELLAQGLGNTVSGLIGGLPITSVIVRSSAGINYGGRTKMMAIVHGFLLFFAVYYLPDYVNMVPLA
jgi:MFS superfamily sulfate permease-like transporter